MSELKVVQPTSCFHHVIDKMSGMVTKLNGDHRHTDALAVFGYVLAQCTLATRHRSLPAIAQTLGASVQSGFGAYRACLELSHSPASAAAPSVLCPASSTSLFPGKSNQSKNACCYWLRITQTRH